MVNRRYVLLDRDGTIVAEKGYLSRPDQLELLPGAVDGLLALTRLGLGLVVITNQSGIGRGFFSLKDLQRVHQHLGSMLAESGVHLDGIYTCPHLPEDDCPCRKPRVGLVRQAEAELGFEAPGGYMVGDKLLDLELGRAVGARSILVRTGYGRHWENLPNIPADAVVDNLAAAADWIATRVRT